MGIVVCKISPRAKRIGFTDVHVIDSTYKPTGREETDSRWHRKHVAPSERAWAKKSTMDRMNVHTAYGFETGELVYLIPEMEGQTLYDCDFGDVYKVVGVIVECNGKLLVQFNEGC